MKDIIIGLQIFLKHGGTNVSAEHDCIYSGQAEGEELSDEEIEELTNNGWFQQQEHCECPRDIEGDVEKHLNNCSQWMTFT